MRVLLLLVALLIALGAALYVELGRHMGEAIGRELGDAFGEVVRDFEILVMESPDLVAEPGSPGYLWRIDTIGPQLHFYDAGANRTTIGGLVRVGSAVARLPVASYQGPPGRELGSADLELNGSVAALRAFPK